MLIVGELINTSRKAVRAAVETRNREAIEKLAGDQEKNGAQYLDVNCGNLLHEEQAAMEWLVETIQNKTRLPLCIDSPNPHVLEAGLSLARYGQPMVNSITAEEKRFTWVSSLLLRYRAKVIALCIDDAGMPDTVEDRLRIARHLIKELTNTGLNLDDIYLDPLVKPISTGSQYGLDVLETIRALRAAYPEIHIICGLSNISFGLPKRRILNQTFLIQTMTVGMDAYILDPTDRVIMGAFWASRALLGQDSYCANYLKAYRNGIYD